MAAIAANSIAQVIAAVSQTVQCQPTLSLEGNARALYQQTAFSRDANHDVRMSARTQAQKAR